MFSDCWHWDWFFSHFGVHIFHYYFSVTSWALLICLFKVLIIHVFYFFRLLCCWCTSINYRVVEKFTFYFDFACEWLQNPLHAPSVSYSPLIQHCLCVHCGDSCSMLMSSFRLQCHRHTLRPYSFPCFSEN